VEPHVDFCSVGVGWEFTPQVPSDAKINVSVVLSDREGRRLATLDQRMREVSGAKLCRVADEGDWSGDDRTVAMALSSISKNVEHIFFVANVTPEGRTFGDLRSAYCRLCAEHNLPLAHHAFEERQCMSGLIMCRLFHDQRYWKFESCGIFFDGRTSKDDRCCRELDHLVFMSELRKGIHPSREGSSSHSACEQERRRAAEDSAPVCNVVPFLEMGPAGLSL